MLYQALSYQADVAGVAVPTGQAEVAGVRSSR